MKKPLKPATVTAGNKLGRIVWGIVWTLFFRPTPRPMHAWRAMLLRLFGASVGKNVRVYQSAKIWAPWNLSMADNSCIGDYVDCYCVAPVTLDEHAIVSQYSFLCTASHDYRDASLPLVVAPIEIGARAWVTADVFIAPGVTIGEGAVIQARSVVLSDMEKWTVSGGHPAAAIQPRN